MDTVFAQKHLWSRRPVFDLLRVQDGFSMVEVIVATLIFAMATAGILATLSALSRPAAESVEDVQAAFIAKEIIENLRSQITADSWKDPSGAFANGSHQQTITRGERTYFIVYNVTDDAAGTGAKEVIVNVAW